jgi:hypothetical protein
VADEGAHVPLAQARPVPPVTHEGGRAYEPLAASVNARRESSHEKPMQARLDASRGRPHTAGPVPHAQPPALASHASPCPCHGQTPMIAASGDGPLAFLSPRPGREWDGAARTVDDGDWAAQRRLMRNRRLDAKAFGLMATSLVLTGAVVVWMFRRAWTDHNVSDPGVTL